MLAKLHFLMNNEENKENRETSWICSSKQNTWFQILT